ncbi:alpha/beta hydrolase [Polycyclovorans algicola]|uniref:alpha/beta hydrolase n=1 Tax=Polycyclovorans algicola TaxID=616992 RepID=UPI0005B82468|nr:alpha/beta hydrolase [Polycyclovorans algicola]
MQRLILTVILALGLSSCAGTAALNSFTPDSGYTVATNLPYQKGSGLRLDVYTPTESDNAPVVVFFYGGRWTDGAKDEFKFVGEALASRGYVAVIADYRKYPAVRFPAFVEDAAKAVKWAHDNVAQYGGDPGKLFVMGHSSGAHMAAMLAMNGKYLEAEGGSRQWLRGMIGLAGPYDFMPISAPDLRDLFGPPDRFEQSQPIFFADGRNPPLLLIHGEDDDVVWVKNSRNLAQAVGNAGGAVETIIYPKLGHRLIIANIARPLRGRSDVLDNISEFINRRANETPRVRGPGVQTTPIDL